MPTGPLKGFAFGFGTLNQQVRLVQFVQRHFHQRVGVRCIEFGCQLVRDLFETVLPIAQLPHERGGRIQGMDLLAGCVIYDKLIAQCFNHNGFDLVWVLHVPAPMCQLRTWFVYESQKRTGQGIWNVEEKLPIQKPDGKKIVGE